MGRSETVASGDIPTRLTTFVGREVERRDLRRLLSEHRLITLTGSGGCGKTRLAQHLAVELGPEYSQAPLWVDLSSVSKPEAVPSAIADALGVTEQPGGGALASAAARLKSEHRLVLLDNCEHLAEACAGTVDHLLQRCPRLTVLATSRSPLAVEGEVLFRVPSLPVPAEEPPPSLDAVASSDAVRLFVERARRARNDFELTPENATSVAAICRRLDGMPLALELAAARVRIRGVEQIADALEDRFKLLAVSARNVVPRQRRLEASVEWSYDLLDERARSAFCALSVFPAPFSLEAAEAVASGTGTPAEEVADVIAELVDQSLVEADVSGPGARYRMLETIRAYAAQRLSADPGKEDEAHDRHLEHFRSLLQRIEPRLQSPEVLEWLDALRPDEPNLAAALDRAVDNGDWDAAVMLACSRYWELSSHTGHPLRVLESALASGTCPDDRRVRAFIAAARLAGTRWDLPSAERLGRHALELARAQDDERAAGEALLAIGTAALWSGRHQEAAESLSEARELAERSGGGPALAAALSGLGQFPFATGDHRQARLLFESASDLARRYGQLYAEFQAANYLFLIHFFAGRDDLAQQACREGLEISRRARLPAGESIFRAFRAGLLIRRGDLDGVQPLLDEAGSLAEVSGHPLAAGHGQQQVALLARARGDATGSLEEFRVLAETARAFNVHIAVIWNASLAAEAAALAGDLVEAALLVEGAATWAAEVGARFPWVSWAEAVVALEQDQPERAEDKAHAALADSQAADNDIVALESLEVLACARARRGDASAGPLLRAVETIRRDRRWAPSPQWAQRVAEAGAQSGKDALAEGASMSLSEAVAYARRGRGERKRPAFGWESLTPTELSVAELVAEGLSNAGIAARLFVTPATVKTHLTHIYAKTGATSRVQLAKAFTENQR
ncbi:MAG TPA: LuxR C-terminal-related transcriptional regulator [Actinomycetota bacterium]|nr:LuxR C-terminal-related transcriptional regulator [Actinomycetota bacterium]